MTALELANDALGDPLFTADQKKALRAWMEGLRGSPQVVLREKTAFYLKKHGQ